jgi:SAM-dependent methyltransferase
MLNYLPGFEPCLDDWTNDDWQTPSDEAAAIATLIQSTELRILDPAAGMGQLLKPIPHVQGRSLTAIELKPGRVKEGKERCPSVRWRQGSFLDMPVGEPFDLILANPPFSLRMDFIRQSLIHLAPSGRLLFLMPIDFNCGKGMGNIWKSLDCHIFHQYSFQHRVAYLDASGTPQKGRQIYDAVFDIRPGRSAGAVSFLE